MWLGLAGLSAAIENLATSIARLTAPDDALEPAGV